MATKQCIACNRKIPDSWELSCQCGHVFKETRTIAGKRFSDYRAELYTRLVIAQSRKQTRKPRVKRNPCAGKTHDREKTRSPNMFRGQKRRQRSRPLLLRQDPTVPTENVKGTAPQHVHPQTHEETTTAQSANSEQSRQGSKSLKMALAEINKRLQNQSKLWVCLASGLPLSTNA